MHSGCRVGLNESFGRAEDEVTCFGITVCREDGVVRIFDPEIYRGEAIFELPSRRDSEILALMLSQQGATVLIPDMSEALKDVSGISAGLISIEYGISAIRKAFQKYGENLVFHQRRPRDLIHTISSDECGSDFWGYNVQIPPGPGERGFKASKFCLEQRRMHL